MLLSKIKKMLVIMITSISLLTVASPAMAAGTTTTLDDNIFKGYTNKLDDGSKPYYYLDITADPEQKDSGNAISNFFTGKALVEPVVNSFYEMKNMIANLAFRFNVFIATMVINGLKMVFNHDVIDQLINDKIEGFMRGVAGVSSSGSFTSSGMFGSLLPFISIFSVLFSLFLFIGKRAQMAAFKSIGSTILVLVLAIGFFSNFGSFLKGMNQIATGISKSVVIGPASIATASRQPMDTVEEDLFSTIWEQFVYRPYLLMQYGTDDVNTIGKKRINELLKMKPDKERLDYIQQKEVIDKGNINMTYTNVDNRLVFTGLYYFFNFLNGFPLFFLMIGQEATQYWFLLIACLAPFVFAWSAFPNQISVLKRYGFHLSLPLIIKIIISLGTFIYFMVSNLIYSINTSNVGGYVTSGISMIAINIVFLLLWKPIKRIFGASSEANLFMNELRAHTSTATQHMGAVKKLAGTVIGGALGGAAGAAIGKGIADAIDDDDDDAEDVRRTKEPNPVEKAPVADLPIQKPPVITLPIHDDEEPTPTLQINDWRDSHEKISDLPEPEETNEQPQGNEQQADEKIKLVELPPLEDENEEKLEEAQ
jgi:hypothetical protein